MCVDPTLFNDDHYLIVWPLIPCSSVLPEHLIFKCHYINQQNQKIITSDQYHSYYIAQIVFYGLLQNKYHISKGFIQPSPILSLENRPITSTSAYIEQSDGDE